MHMLIGFSVISATMEQKEDIVLCDRLFLARQHRYERFITNTIVLFRAGVKNPKLKVIPISMSFWISLSNVDIFPEMTVVLFRLTCSGDFLLCENIFRQ
jgi:hypothetical protein